MTESLPSSGNNPIRPTVFIHELGSSQLNNYCKSNLLGFAYRQVLRDATNNLFRGTRDFLEVSLRLTKEHETILGQKARSVPPWMGCRMR